MHSEIIEMYKVFLASNRRLTKVVKGKHLYSIEIYYDDARSVNGYFMIKDGLVSCEFVRAYGLFRYRSGGFSVS